MNSAMDNMILSQNLKTISNRKKMVTILPKPTNLIKLSANNNASKVESKCQFVRPWESTYHSKNISRPKYPHPAMFQDSFIYPWSSERCSTFKGKYPYLISSYPQKTNVAKTNNHNRSVITYNKTSSNDSLNDSGYSSPCHETKSRCHEMSKTNKKTSKFSSESNKSGRKHLDRRAVILMETWYQANFQHPYPDRKSVEFFASNGGISIVQVKKWMANKRVRSFNTLSFNGSLHPKRIAKKMQSPFFNLPTTLSLKQRNSIPGSPNLSSSSYCSSPDCITTPPFGMVSSSHPMTPSHTLLSATGSWLPTMNK